MGLTIAILAIALVAEVGFTAYCLVTRANQTQVRSWMRIGLLAAFVLAMLVSIIHWSFRWYLLAVLLVVWAGLGAWALLGKRPERKAFSPWRSVLGAVGRLLLVLLVLIPALLIPQFTLPKPSGPYKIATASYTFTDPNRIETFTDTGEQRKVNVGCWYPEDASGKFPLLVFSHGAFGMKAGNMSTFMNLASNGYVACSVDHPYHSLLTIDTEGNRVTANGEYVQRVMDAENGKLVGTSGFAITQERLALRVADIDFVVSTLKERAQSPGLDPVFLRIDTEHIGLFGHSVGGATSAKVARLRDDIDAAIDLDGTLSGEYLGYKDDTYVVDQTIFPVPLLIVYTDPLGRNISATNDPEGLNPINRIPATAPNAFKVHLQGANHMSVTDLPLISPLSVALILSLAPPLRGSGCDDFATIEHVNQLVLEFFDVYLKGQGSFSAPAEL